VSAVGGSVRPLTEHPTVRLDAEYVHIQFIRNDAWVECVFFLNNLGPATTVTLGFPNFSGGADVNAVHPSRSLLPTWTVTPCR